MNVASIIADLDALRQYTHGRPSRIEFARRVRALREKVAASQDLTEAKKLEVDTILGKLVQRIFTIEIAGSALNPLSDAFVRMERLVGGAKVDLDEPIDGDVDL
jgi:hypothetical protein